MFKYVINSITESAISNVDLSSNKQINLAIHVAMIILLILVLILAYMVVSPLIVGSIYLQSGVGLAVLAVVMFAIHSIMVFTAETSKSQNTE
jgi:flagellar biogenesis protein FliO